VAGHPAAEQLGRYRSHRFPSWGAGPRAREALRGAQRPALLTGCAGRSRQAGTALVETQQSAAGEDHPRTPRTIDTDGHISRSWFRKAIWLPALETAQLGFHVTPHGLRHAHASWLLAGGATCRSSRNASVTPPSPRPISTFTPSPTPTKQHSTLWQRSEPPRTRRAGQRTIVMRSYRNCAERWRCSEQCSTPCGSGSGLTASNRIVDTEEVTGSIPLSPTTKEQASESRTEARRVCDCGIVRRLSADLASSGGPPLTRP